MSIEQNKITAARWLLDVIMQGKLAVADEIFAANHVAHDPHGPAEGWPQGPEGMKLVATVLGGDFSSWNIEIDQIAEGDKVATRWIACATNTGPVMGIPATGMTINVTGCNITRLAEGKIVESWFNFDMLTLLQQIGAIPTPENAGH
jgi:hypothetical protein